MSETWRPVTEFPDTFEVSSEGRIRSIPRVLIRSNGRPHTVRQKIKRINSVNPITGYVQVCLRADGKSQTRMLHNIVTRAFLGPKTPALPWVRHLNGDKLDNRLCNLVYGTGVDNAQDRVRHGHDHNANKTHCVNGHQYTPENTVIVTGGWRKCRTCKRIQEREGRQRRKFHAKN
jgi:hypothetical protein